MPSSETTQAAAAVRPPISFDATNRGLNAHHMFQNQDFDQRGTEQIAAPPRPVWDRVRRELRYGEKVVKRFKWPALNQERVLDAFQENGWPTKIMDPLDVDPKICPKRRLHDTLKCLNRKQVNAVIKFRGDGTGRGVLLEFVQNDEA